MIETSTHVPEKFWPGPTEGTWTAYGRDIPETGWQFCGHHNPGLWYAPPDPVKRGASWDNQVHVVRPLLDYPSALSFSGGNTITTTDDAGRLDPETWEFASTDGCGWVSVDRLALDDPDIPVIVRQKPAPSTVFETPASKAVKEFLAAEIKPEKTENTVMTIWTSRDGVHNLRNAKTHYQLQVRVDRVDDYNNVPVHVEVPHDLSGT